MWRGCETSAATLEAVRASDKQKRLGGIHAMKRLFVLLAALAAHRL
jgi:hypothetical protein